MDGLHVSYLCHPFAKNMGLPRMRNGAPIGQFCEGFIFAKICEELLAIRRIFSLVDMITNTKFSNCPNVFKIGVVWQ